MQRLTLGLLWWLVLCSVARSNSSEHSPSSSEEEPQPNSKECKQNCKNQPSQDDGQENKKGSCKKRCNQSKKGIDFARCCMDDINNFLENGVPDETIAAIESLEEVLQGTDISATTPLSIRNVVALLHKPKGHFRGLEIFASDNEAMSDKMVPNSRVSVRLPRELNLGQEDTVVFCMLNVTEVALGASSKLYNNRLIGLSVPRDVSGLRENVNITINLTTAINPEKESPQCHYFNFSTREFNRSGCGTEWHEDRGYITCSCDHLTYFGILLVSPELSEKDQEILKYITLIGCSLSFFTLVISVLLFATNRKLRADLSMKVHVNLAIALILLNVHFLHSEVAAARPSAWPCLYVAIGLHYSLVATFVWTALEGFHLYLLFVKVYNIYVRKYILKLGLVGWGVPAVIVALVAIIDINSYGQVPIDSSNANSTLICYITDNTVKMVTTLGVFCLVYLFNLIMFGVAIKRIVSFHLSSEYGEGDRERTKRGVCTLLGLSTLLGITWGLVFFSFGYLTTPGLYLFCILNSLHGFFIFLWFVMSLRKTVKASARSSSETHSTKT